MSTVHHVTLRAPRVLYLPNESEQNGENGQVGGRAAFKRMLGDGTIGALTTYSFLASYYESGKSATTSHAELLDTVAQCQPEIIFWSHPDDYPVTDELILAIRRVGANPLLVYHEGDPFDRWYKRLGNPQRKLYAASDVFFTVGLGDGRRLFEAIRPHKHLYHTQSYTECERFGDKPATGVLGSRFDAVMIGNIPKRLGLLRHPGSPERVRLARGLRKRFGSRFACYGSGWPDHTNAAGPIRHVTQRDVIQTSRMSLMWEHFPRYSYYYSDRLPIALAAGVPFITSARAGYDILFPNVPGLFLAATVEDALDLAVYLRSLSLETLAGLGEAGRRWVLENLDASIVFKRMMTTCIACLHGRLREQGDAR